MFKALEAELLLITRTISELIFPVFRELMMDFRVDPHPDAKTQRFKFLKFIDNMQI